MSNLNQRTDRAADGKLLRGKYRGRSRGPRCPSGTPKWWRRLFMTRPRRHATRACCAQALHATDPDAITFPLGNHKPHEYYW